MSGEEMWDGGETLFRQVWEYTSDAMALSDKWGIVRAANPAYLELYGYALDAVVGQSFAIIFPVAERQAALEQYRRVFAGEAPPPSFESVIVRADGVQRVVEARATFLSTDGKRTAMLSTIRDITERKAAQAALRRAEERLRLTLAGINDYAVFTQDLAGRVVDWNSVAEQIFGYRANEIMGQPAAILFAPEEGDAGPFPDAGGEMLLARSKGRAGAERWYLRKDGTPFYASSVLTPLHNSELYGYVKVIHDLSEHRLVEAEVRRLHETLEKRVAEGTEQVRQVVTQLTLSEQAERRRISAILHDELQQRLFSLALQLEMLQTGHEHYAPDQLDRAREEEFAGIQAGVRECIRITRDLSVDLSPPILHNEDLAEALLWLAAQMQAQQGFVVDVQVVGRARLLHEDLRVLLFQIVRELLMNVLKHAGVQRATVKLTYTPEQLHIEIADKGQGFVPADARARGPKSQGLLRSKQRLQLVGAQMVVTSMPGQGAHITLTIPLHGRERGGPPAAKS